MNNRKTAPMGGRPRVLLLTNVPTPNRLPVFEAMAQAVDLTVFFCQAADPARLWHADLHSEHVRYEALPARTFPVGRGVEMVFNSGLRSRLRREPFDFYVAGENFPNAASVLELWREARRRHRPFGLWSEAIDTAFASGQLLSNAYRRWLYRRTDAFIAYGRRPKEFLVRRGADPDRVTLGLQVIPAEQLPPPAASKVELGLAGKRVTLFVGYFTPRKGAQYLLKAFQETAGASDVLALIGSGPDDADLRALAEGDNRILFPGYFDGPAKSSWYAASDVFVLPTLHDPWGVVANEAMHFGLPVLTTDAAGCVPDIVRPGENGLVVPAGDVEALAGALDRLLQDSDLRREMGARSRAIISGYTTATAAKRWIEFISRAIAT
jgi:glycosyltransferase involved in cell wall biosynthesis